MADDRMKNDDLKETWALVGAMTRMLARAASRHQDVIHKVVRQDSKAWKTDERIVRDEEESRRWRDWTTVRQDNGLAQGRGGQNQLNK